MITLGIILLILGLLFFHPLFVIGIILLIVGLVFLVTPLGGSRRYY